MPSQKSGERMWFCHFFAVTKFCEHDRLITKNRDVYKLSTYMLMENKFIFILLLCDN